MAPSGLVELEKEEGQKIALPGVVVGGGIRDDGVGNLGVFLRYDPEAFGLQSTAHSRQGEAQAGGGGFRTGFTEALITDEADETYNLEWYGALSDNIVASITQLRELIADEFDPIDLHFMYRELERRLYRSRDAFASALEEYDGACRAHDEAMSEIRPALFEKFGNIPLLETYKQQTIRQQKTKNFDSARWWAQRGIDLYREDAADSSWVQDLRTRLGKLDKRLPTAKAAAAASLRSENDVIYETLQCHSCGTDFERELVKGRKPHECPECRGQVTI